MTSVAPNSPSCWATAAKMKSVWMYGMLSWLPRPRPVPINPPLAMANAALIGW